jgi:hypothetical protein
MATLTSQIELNRIGLSIVALQRHFHLHQNLLQLMITLFYESTLLGISVSLKLPMAIFKRQLSGHLHERCFNNNLLFQAVRH